MSAGFVLSILCAQGAYGIPFQIDHNPSETWVHMGNPSPLVGPNGVSGHSAGVPSKEAFHLAFASHQRIPLGFFDIPSQYTEKGIAGIDAQSDLSQPAHVHPDYGIGGEWSLTTCGVFSGGRSTWDYMYQHSLLDGGEYVEVDLGEISRTESDDSSFAQPSITADTGTPSAKGGVTMLMLGLSLIGMAAIGRNKVIRRL